jgi:two-component system, response regulator PdtaR
MGTAARPRSQRVVLVVDDEDLVRHVAARILADAGFRVLQAADGNEALALLAPLDGAVDLVLADIKMPNMTGTELANLVTRRWPGVPVLLMSGYSLPTAEPPGAFLPKPFTAGLLLDAVGGLVPLPKQ